MATTTESVTIDNIEVNVYEPPVSWQWRQLARSTKLSLMMLSEPITTTTARNTTTTGMHEWAVAQIDPFGPSPPDISTLAVGRGTTATTEGDDALTDEVSRVAVTSLTREGATLRVKTFLDKDNGNVDVSAGESLSEVGLYADDTLLNHAILDNDIDKTDTKTATIDVLIIFDSP